MAVVGMLGAILASRWCMVASQELRCHGGHACGNWDPVCVSSIYGYLAHNSLGHFAASFDVLEAGDCGRRGWLVILL